VNTAVSNSITRDLLAATMTTAGAPLALTLLTTFALLLASPEVPPDTASALGLMVVTLAHLIYLRSANIYPIYHPFAIATPLHSSAA
jgi:hypothetical protein